MCSLTSWEQCWGPVPERAIKPLTDPNPYAQLHFPAAGFTGEDDFYQDIPQSTASPSPVPLLMTSLKDSGPIIRPLAIIFMVLCTLWLVYWSCCRPSPRKPAHFPDNDSDDSDHPAPSSPSPPSAPVQFNDSSAQTDITVGANVDTSTQTDDSLLPDPSAAALAEANDKNAKLLARAETAEEGLATAEREAREQLERKEEAEKKREEAETLAAARLARAEVAEEERAAAEREAARQMARVEEAEEKRGEAETAAAAHSARMEEAEEETAKQVKRAEAAERANRTLKADLEDQEVLVDQQTELIDALEGQVAAAEADAAESSRRSDALDAENWSLKETHVRQLAAAEERRGGEVEELRKTIEELREQLRALSSPAGPLPTDGNIHGDDGSQPRPSSSSGPSGGNPDQPFAGASDPAPPTTDPNPTTSDPSEQQKPGSSTGTDTDTTTTPSTSTTTPPTTTVDPTQKCFKAHNCNWKKCPRAHPSPAAHHEGDYDPTQECEAGVDCIDVACNGRHPSPKLRTNDDPLVKGVHAEAKEARMRLRHGAGYLPPDRRPWQPRG